MLLAKIFLPLVLTKLFGREIINIEAIMELLVRFFITLFFIVIQVRVLYYTSARRKDYLFTYILIGVSIFLLCFLLESVKLKLGFALGLFAIFGIIRYRTVMMPIKEMTYMFVVIVMAVLNSLANETISIMELVITNFIILGITWALERVFLLKHETQKLLIYEKIENIKLQNRALLKAEIEERTGLKINRLEIGKIDFLKDVAQVIIFYYEIENRVNLSDNENLRDASDDD